MFKNYLISAYRNFIRNKFYTLINILGLTIGLAAFIFILLFIRDELTYDRYNKKYERIHRLESNFNIAGKHEKFAIVPIPMGPAFQLEFPEVKTFTRLTNAGNVLIRYDDHEYYEKDFYFADSTVFDVFTYEFLLGEPENALTKPNTIVITEKVARKYFGKNNPLGEFLETGSGTSYNITAVIKDLPTNSHLKFDALLSAVTMAQNVGVEDFNSMEPIRFWNIGVYTYILLHKNTGIQSIYDKFPPFYEKYMKPVGDQINASFDLLTTPLAQTHFSSGLSADLPTGNLIYIYIFSAVAVFILLLAAINYMNMATARSTKRAREVGMRKVVGAYKSQLIRQFIGESMLLAIFSFIIAIIAVYFLLPDFNNITGKSLNFNMILDPAVLIMILLVIILIGIVSGSYPAFFLSSFKPVSVLKGTLTRSGRKSGFLRKVLVVIQFFIAIVMIIATIAVSGQLKYLRNKNLGFDKENVIVLQLQDSTFRSKVESFKKELLLNPNITGVSNSTGIPGTITWIQVMYVEKEEKMTESALILAQVDYDFIDVMGMEIINGRNFDEKMGTDQREAVIINETGAKVLGWEENPVGKKIDYEIDLEGNIGRPMKVIGVINDFHFRSLHNKVEPVILFISEVPRYFLSIKIEGNNTRETLDFIEEKWNDFGAKRPFDYEFMDQRMDEMYDAEVKLGLIFRIATILTIFIALLGLLGLSSFTAEQRTKEIGIRKILGASVSNILKSLYKEFIILILIAFILAVPVAWWRIDIWMNTSFIYHATLQWTTFLIAGLLALVIGFITISYHIIRAASENPVDAINYE